MEKIEQQFATLKAVNIIAPYYKSSVRLAQYHKYMTSGRRAHFPFEKLMKEILSVEDVRRVFFNEAFRSWTSLLEVRIFICINCLKLTLLREEAGFFSSQIERFHREFKEGIHS